MNLPIDEAKPALCVIDRNLSFERFIELHFGTGEAEALRLRRDLEAASVPLHDVVVADQAFVMKAADMVKALGSGPPRRFRVARRAAEAPVVVGQEAAQDLVGSDQIVGPGQTQLAGEAILEGSPKTFDTALGLRSLGRNVGDAELFQCAAELSGLAVTGQLFLDGPMIVVADKDAVAITIEAERYAEATQQALEQSEIAASVFGGKEFGDQNFARGVVEKSEQGQLRAAIFQPAVKAGVEQNHFAFPGTGQAALAMSGSATLARRADPGRAQQTAKGFAPEREAFLLDQFFAQVMVVEAGIGGAGQLQDAIPHALRQTARAGSSAAGVCQSRLTALP